MVIIKHRIYLKCLYASDEVVTAGKLVTLFLFIFINGGCCVCVFYPSKFQKKNKVDLR